MKNGECVYVFESKPANGNMPNGNSEKKIYYCVKENGRKICQFINNYCACPKYEPR